MGLHFVTYLNFYVFIYVYEYVPVSLYVSHMWAGTFRGQKKVSGHLKLKLQEVVTCWWRCWDPNTGPQQVWQILLMTEPSLLP